MFGSLFRAVLLLFLMIIPGFVMRKLKFADDRLPLGFSNTILYITQPAMIIIGFFRPRDMEVLKTAGIVLVLSFAVHIVFLLVCPLFFRKAEKEKRKIYRFGIVFANAGYMGIPLISMVLGEEAAIYASVYIVAFNFFCWSVGAMMYAEDRSYISPRKMFVNAATVPTAIGILIFVTDFYSILPAFAGDFIYEALEMLKNTVAPMSMMIIGMRLADVKVKGIFSDRYLYPALVLRLLALPALAFGMLYLCKIIGFYDPTAFTVVLVCASAPVASITSMYAEKFGSDTACASKLVSVSTVLSLATMPVMALLLDLL